MGKPFTEPGSGNKGRPRQRQQSTKRRSGRRKVPPDTQATDAEGAQDEAQRLLEQQHVKAGAQRRLAENDKDACLAELDSQLLAGQQQQL